MIYIFQDNKTKRMKTSKKPFAHLLFTMLIMCTSCTKNDGLPRGNNTPHPIIDSLAGKEFQFDNLIWDSDDINVYLLIKNRPDLFTYPRNFVVLLRLDTLSEWIPVLQGPVNPPFNGFVYSAGSGNLRILSYLPDLSILNMSPSVRVKF
jgi:hypothetical protein